jgi:hypothetical protein
LPDLDHVLGGSAASGRERASVSMKREKIAGRRFEDEKIVLDGAEYADCTFKDCLIVITGKDQVRVTNCTFVGATKLKFEGPAFNTVEVLSALYTDPAFQSIIEKVITDIRGTIETTKWLR